MPLATQSLAHLLRIGHDPTRLRELAASIDGDVVTLDPASPEWRAEKRGALGRFKSGIKPSEPKSAPALQPRATVRAPSADLSCVHRGEHVRDQLCPTCSGTVNAKVFACVLLGGECSPFKIQLPGVKGCAGCQSREPAPTAVAG